MTDDSFGTATARELRAAVARVRAVADGRTINGSYRAFPIQALDAFRADLLAIVETAPLRPSHPTEDAYMAACRALHWRMAQLRANGIEPIEIPINAPHYPPDGFFDATRPIPT